MTPRLCHSQTPRLCQSVLLGLLATCTSPPAPVTVSRSSTLVLDAFHTLWVTSPDDDSLVAVDPDTLAVTRTLALAGAPSELALVGDTLVVTLAQSPEIALVSTRAPFNVTRVRTPCGATRAVVALNPHTALASCPWDDLLVEIDLSRAAVTRTLPSPGRPTALVRAGDALYVTASRLGRLRTLSLDGTLRADTALETTPGFNASQPAALDADPSTGEPLAVFQRVDRDADRTRPAAQGGYGSVSDGAPRIEPRLLAPCGARYARFDGGLRVFSGPSALAYDASTETLWVAHRSTDNVVALRCPHGENTSEAAVSMRAVWRVGRAPRAIALSPDGRTAWVDVGFDHAVARLTLSDDASRVREPDAARRRPFTTSLSDAALRGRSLFDDATNTHLTPSGVVTCATCHPDGGDDGLTWFLHTPHIARKLRRTPPAWGAREDNSALHWDAGFHSASTLARTTLQELMGGDGLLVDTDAFAAWMAAAPTPPARPLTDDEIPRAQRGLALFTSPAVGCAGCHAGPALSDRQLHAVLAPSRDPDGALPEARTPTLRAVRTHPPYLHDGRAETLRAVLTEHNPNESHGRTRALSEPELADLLTYLQSL